MSCEGTPSTVQHHAEEQAASDVLCWPDLVFDKDRVRALGVAATCRTCDGGLWEFERGGFYVTAAGVGTQRRRVWEDFLVPPGPWQHEGSCACPLCRASGS